MAQCKGDNRKAGKGNKGKSASLKTSSIRSGSRPSVLKEESVLGNGLLITCNAPDASNLADAGGISFPVSER